jgi:outer membrane protein OmpA-like peptidoglycan-associated protein
VDQLQASYPRKRISFEMEKVMTFNHRKFATMLALATLALGVISQSASAGDLSAQQIISGLKAPRTRSLVAGASTAQPAPLSAADAAFINRVRKTRSLSSADRDQIAAIAKDRPSVDVEIYFDYNSAAVTPKAEPQLNSLGQALTSQDLAGSVVMLGGHTDAKGTDSYNQGLSERRAATVKKFLVENYHIPADSLISTGYGKRELKNPNDPFAAENRRVQIVNMANSNEANNTQSGQ